MAKITLYTDDYTKNDIIEAQKEIFNDDQYKTYNRWEEVPEDRAIAFIGTDKNIQWDGMHSEFEKITNGYCVISGRYDTNYPGYPVQQSGDGGFITTSYYEFINVFEDCDYWTIEDDDGLLLIKASHHDGTYTVAVKVLTNAGIEWYEDAEYDGISRREEVEMLFNSDKYSEKPYLAKKLGYTN